MTCRPVPRRAAQPLERLLRVICRMILIRAHNQIGKVQQQLTERVCFTILDTAE